MNGHFFFRLAATNIKNNRRFYVPYLLAGAGTVMMFYIMTFITFSKDIGNLPGANVISSIMVLGCIVVAIVTVVLLLYTNSFLMKRRKKEFGLYSILGMEKRHVARVMAAETLITSLVSICGGLLLGMLFSKLMLLLLIRLLGEGAVFGFYVSLLGIAVTTILFAVIYILTLLTNLVRVGRSKPIELLYSDKTGEREPKTKILLTIIGALTLGLGYYIAITTENPLSAIGLFFIAVLLVIVGTYCLFTAGSIALLKALRANKKYYYRTKHFTSVSGMIYRMKQNALGLANICILSTMVLVMISTTAALYVGIADALRELSPRNIEIRGYADTEAAADSLFDDADETLSALSLTAENPVRYRYRTLNFDIDGDFAETWRGDDTENGEGYVVYLIPLSSYNKMPGVSPVSLAEDELLLWSPNADYSFPTISLNGSVFRVRTKLDTLGVEFNSSQKYSKMLYLILPDEKTVKALYGGEEAETLNFYYGFDLENEEQQEKVYSALETKYAGAESTPMVTCAADMKSDVFAIYGGLFFLGIMLGTLFIMITVLIMYYKQLSEGYEDKERFEIMQKVGMSKKEVRATIKSQVLTVFFLPLGVACVHVAAAFNMIVRILSVINLTNVPLFAVSTVCTIAAFALVYTAVYAVTSRVYYHIVENK